MKIPLFKRWSSILVIFAMFAQVAVPGVLATDDNEIDLSDVDSSDAVDVLDDILEEGENADEEIEEIIGTLLDDVDTTEEAETLIEEIEGDITDMVEGLEDEAVANPLLRLKYAKRILQHKAFLLRLRARAIMRYNEIAVALKTVKEGRHLYQIRWGVLNQIGQERCPGVSRNDIISSLEAGNTPDCDVDQADYEGMVSVNKGSLKIMKEILFENNDEVTEDSGSSVEWSSHIAGHWDGLIVEYTPDSDQDEKVEVTISIGDINEAFIGSESMGQKAISNGHHVAIKPLALALEGVTDNVQDKLVENKVEIQEKLAKIRDRVRRVQLVRTGTAGDIATESNELEELLEEIEEYNFDDASNEEIGNEIDAVLEDLSDGASGAQIRNRIQRLRGMFVTIKDKAKARKFAQNYIPFKDTDDNEWYTKYVAPMKEKGIVSGYKDVAGNELGEYRPGNNVTVAETLKIGLETSNNGNSDGVPALAAAMNHWAKAYVKRAEELGLDLVVGDTDLNRPATRGEVIRMMLEAAGVNPDNVQGTSFSDVPASHKHAAYIALAKELGIVSGDDGANTFRPDAPINRAEVAKIANQILEVLLGQ